jgi:hypothetical protein
MAHRSRKTESALSFARTYLKIDFLFQLPCHRERRRRVVISKSLINRGMRLLHGVYPERSVGVRNDSLSVIKTAHFNFEIGSSIHGKTMHPKKTRRGAPRLKCIIWLKRMRLTKSSARPETDSPLRVVRECAIRPIRKCIMERVMGIEPTLSAWEAEVLPLNYTRLLKRITTEAQIGLDYNNGRFLIQRALVHPCMSSE